MKIIVNDSTIMTISFAEEGCNLKKSHPEQGPSHHAAHPLLRIYSCFSIRDDSQCIQKEKDWEDLL